MHQQLVLTSDGKHLLLTQEDTGTWGDALGILWDSRSGEPCPADVLTQAQADMAGAATAEAWSDLREKRDELLSASDWTQMPDNQLEAALHAAWEIYRQALRALPEVTSDPANPAWPVPPGSA